MSAMLSSGLVGVSTQIIRGAPGRNAARTASRSCERHGGPVQAPVLGDLGEEPVGAAVRVVRDHHVVARPAHRPQQGVLGRQAAGEGQPAPAALERRQALLQRVAGRVAGAAVLVARAAARRRRPGRTCWSGRSAAPPRRYAGPAPGRRGWRACRSRTSLAVMLRKASLTWWRTACSAASWRVRCPRSWSSTTRTGWRSSTPGRCSRATCWWCPRAHVVTLPDLPADLLPGYFGLVQRLAAAVPAALGAQRHVRGDQQHRVAVGAAPAHPRRAPHQGRRPARLLLAPAPSTPPTTRPRRTPRDRRPKRLG